MDGQARADRGEEQANKTGADREGARGPARLQDQEVHLVPAQEEDLGTLLNRRIPANARGAATEKTTDAEKRIRVKNRKSKAKMGIPQKDEKSYILDTQSGGRMGARDDTNEKREK